jgi:cell division protein FtsI/penicillin-binding protein 2
MSFKGNELTAQYGLERQYNDVLDKQKNNIYANFFVEVFSSLGDSLSGKDGSGSIVTTIEPTVQSFIEKEIVR